MRFLDLAEALPDREFVMVGPHDNDDPDYYDQVERRAETLPNCSFKGFVAPDEIHEYFRRAALLVNTSDYEGFGNVFLEAWRYETPVVSLHYTLHGVIDEEPVGVHAGSIDALTEAVDSLLNDIDRRREYGTTGRKHVADEYSFPSVLAAYETVFDRIAPRSDRLQVLSFAPVTPVHSVASDVSIGATQSRGMGFSPRASPYRNTPHTTSVSRARWYRASEIQRSASWSASIPALRSTYFRSDALEITSTTPVVERP